MTLLWTLNRLRSMSLPEITHRAGEKVKKIAAQRRLEGWARYRNDGRAPVLEGMRQQASALDDATRSAAARAATAILEGRFSVLGREWPKRSPDNLFSSGFWRLDPVTGKSWPGPEQYCFDIAYRHESELGDIKYVWEANRLQFLHPLAMQVFLLNDPWALAAIEECVTSWYAANPPFRGLAWNSGIEVALRAISLLVVASLAGDRLSPDTLSKIRTILNASLFWLSRFPSRYSSANNHRIAEAAGIYLIALALPELRGAQAAQARAGGILEEEAVKQFHADGVPAEQSPTYGAFSAEFLLLSDACAPLPPAVRLRLGRFANFVFALADTKGRVPAIGDDDEGRMLAFAPTHTYAFDIARRIGPVRHTAGIAVFREGGYSVIRNQRFHLVFDHGPLGYLSIAAHGHADALSIALSLDDEPLLLDPGTYLYHSGGDERDWFRGTPAHNTLNIDGHNQSVISGPFNWSSKARCRLEEVPADQNWHIAASHDGYASRFGIRHHRMIAVDGTEIRLKDHLTGGAREAEIVLQLAPGLQTAPEGPEWRVYRDGAPIAAFTFAPGTVTVRDSGVSPTFGVKLFAPRLSWRGKVDDKGVVTIIQALGRIS